MSYTRVQQEKEFHNKRFGAETDQRAALGKYYGITGSSTDYYYNFLQAHCQDKHVLEYGCGTGSAAFLLAQKGAIVTGIDISDVAIDRARQVAQEKGLAAKFYVMDAEALDLPDDTFDLICGLGILHHLDLNKAYAELARVLAPTGTIIFREPLGHNFLVNLYRRFTPTVRTESEHPLLVADLDAAGTFFQSVEVKYFYLLALLAVLFRKYSFSGPLLAFLERVDQQLFSLLPFMKRYAWIAVIILAQPKKRE